MKCEICNNNDAEMLFTQVYNGVEREIHVCSGCAEKGGFNVQSPMYLTDFLFGMGQQPELEGLKGVAPCPSCGMTLAQFQHGTLLGCSECYEAFMAELEPFLMKMHRNCRHIGKVPSRRKIEAQILSLETAMNRAVNGQDYEEAAKLRDRIQELKNVGGSDRVS